MGCSQNYGTFLVTNYFMTPKIQGYQHGTLILETADMENFGIPFGFGARGAGASGGKGHTAL